VRGNTKLRRAIDGQFRLTDSEIAQYESLPAMQRPNWQDDCLLADVRNALSSLPNLVAAHDVDTLCRLLAEVANGKVQVVQSGDCAEDPAECTPSHIARKAGLLDVLAGAMKMKSHKPVVRVGRIAGQFGKPRSRPTEKLDGYEIPVYRGHMVNSPEPDAEHRRPDPKRLLAGYWAASAAMASLGSGASDECRAELPIWTSHEALLLDYEVPMLRRDESGRLLLTSTHWPWIGNRTRQLGGAHVAMLAAVANPVACKVSADMEKAELLGLCERLDPDRVPGRLTFIARMGADEVADRLSALVVAAHSAGHPIIWMCDPMHGNTVSAPGGRKTRLVDSIICETVAFHAAVKAAGAVAGGLHLEATPDDVNECVADESGIDEAGSRSTTLCDPRLNPQQAFAVALAWNG